MFLNQFSSTKKGSPSKSIGYEDLSSLSRPTCPTCQSGLHTAYRLYKSHSIPSISVPCSVVLCFPQTHSIVHIAANWRHLLGIPSGRPTPKTADKVGSVQGVPAMALDFLFPALWHTPLCGKKHVRRHHVRLVAELVEKRHCHLIRDIRKYCNDFVTEMSPNLDSSPMFIPSYYSEMQGNERSCNLLNQQGCDFIVSMMKGNLRKSHSYKCAEWFHSYIHQSGTDLQNCVEYHIADRSRLIASMVDRRCKHNQTRFNR